MAEGEKHLAMVNDMDVIPEARAPEGGERTDEHKFIVDTIDDIVFGETGGDHDGEDEGYVAALEAGADKILARLRSRPPEAEGLTVGPIGDWTELIRLVSAGCVMEAAEKARAMAARDLDTKEGGRE